MANLVLGRGILYFDEFAAGTENTQGEVKIAQTTDFTVSASSEDLDHFDQDEGIRVLDESIQIQLDRTGGFTAQDITDDLIAMFALGSVSSVSQLSTPIVDEAITVKKGRYYQLGASDAAPSGVRNVSAVVVQDVTDVTTYVLDTDYSLDAVTGRIFIITAGAISDDDVLHVDYTPAAENRTRVVSAANKVLQGALRFISANPKGLGRDWYMPKATIVPNGDFALKGDGWQQVAFTFKALKKTGSPGALIVDGRVAP